MGDEIENPIAVDPEIKGGTLVFAGTQVPVHTLFHYLQHGSLEEYLDEFRTVRREQALRLLASAGWALLSGARGGYYSTKTSATGCARIVVEGATARLSGTWTVLMR